MKTCKPKNNYGSFNTPLAAYFNSFVDRGIMADFTESRGTRTKNITIDYQSTGPNVFFVNALINFPRDLELDNSTIKAIELLSTDSLAFAPTYPLKDIPETYFNRGTLQLIDFCEAIVFETPLTNLSRKTNGNKLTFTNLKNIDWAASGVIFSSGAVIGANNALVFKIHY